MGNQKYKFRGGLWTGGIITKWPSAKMEINKDSLVIFDELFQKKYELSRNEIIKVEAITLFPVFGHYVKIQNTNKNYSKEIYFGVSLFSFGKIKRVLKEFNWLSKS